MYNVWVYYTGLSGQKGVRGYTGSRGAMGFTGAKGQKGIIVIVEILYFWLPNWTVSSSWMVHQFNFW